MCLDVEMNTQKAKIISTTILDVKALQSVQTVAFSNGFRDTVRACSKLFKDLS